MTLTGLLRIFFRWKRWGLATFALTLIGGSLAAILHPLSYESQIVLEKEPTRISYRPLDAEYDVTRFTSENQRTIAMLKSRYLMQQWFQAIGLSAPTSRAYERKLKKLTLSLVAKPVNFTDLYVLKVQGPSPDEASRRVQILTDLYQRWDADQYLQQNAELIALLKRRLDSLVADLDADRGRLQREKLTRTLNLSGSVPQGAIETRLQFKQQLYAEITNELEQAEREADPVSARRVRIAVPVTASNTPLWPRRLLLLTSFLGSAMAAISVMLVAEWQNRRICRAGDIYRCIGPRTVLMVPDLDNGPRSTFEPSKALAPLLHAMEHLHRNEKRPIVVQVLSAERRDGKSTVCDWLIRACEAMDRKPRVIAEAGNFTAHIVEARQNEISPHDIFLIELPSLPDALAGSHVTDMADITCVVLSTAKTTWDHLRILDQHIRKGDEQLTFFILNRWHDPLPLTWRNS